MTFTAARRAASERHPRTRAQRAKAGIQCPVSHCASFIPAKAGMKTYSSSPSAASILSMFSSILSR